MIYVVTGTRSLRPHQAAHVERTLARYAIDGEDELYVGCAGGVDRLVRNGYSVDRVFEATWDTYGRSAGPRRNGEMLDHAYRLGCPEDVLVLAFPAPGSKGTWDCVRQAAARGLTVHIHPVPL